MWCWLQFLFGANKRADWVEVECAVGVWWRTAVALVNRAIPACTWRAHPPPAKTADDAPMALCFVSVPLSLSALGLFWYLIFALYECPVCIYKITSSVWVIVLPYDIFYTICHLLQTEDSVCEPVRRARAKRDGCKCLCFCCVFLQSGELTQWQRAEHEPFPALEGSDKLIH